jgi:hypothetical protein
MMELIPHNPTEGVYSTGGDWVHAMEVRGAERLLFVSGTMGLRPTSRRRKRSTSSWFASGTTSAPSSPAPK